MAEPVVNKNNPVKPSFGLPKKKSFSNDTDVKPESQLILKDMAENVELNTVEQIPTKRKVSLAASTSGAKKAKKIKDPSAPKRPVSAFMIFSAEENTKDVGNLSFAEKSKSRHLQTGAPYYARFLL